MFAQTAVWQVPELAPLGLLHASPEQQSADIPLLVAADIADIITWAVTRPPHVNVDHLRVTPLAQASATLVHRVP